MIAKIVDRGAVASDVIADLADIDLAIVPFDRAQAEVAGLLRADSRAAGLSLGDRACLALARTLGATALTADRAWASLKLDTSIVVVR